MSREGKHDTNDTTEYVNFDDRVSSFYEQEPRVGMRMVVAGKTHPGNVRPNNEDHFAVVHRYRGRELMTSSLPEGMFEPTEQHAYALVVADVSEATTSENWPACLRFGPAGSWEGRRSSGR